MNQKYKKKNKKLLKPRGFVVFVLFWKDKGDWQPKGKKMEIKNHR